MSQVTALGPALVLRRGELAMEPFTEVGRYVHGDESIETWKERLETLELSDLEFSGLARLTGRSSEPDTDPPVGKESAQ